MKLEEIYNNINKEICNIDISGDAKIFEGLANNISTYMLSCNYYRALASYCKLYKPCKVLEIGTCSGASALVMSRYCENLLTVDIDLSKVINRLELERVGINFKQIDRSEVFDLDFGSYDFIFIDIDHGGISEIILHNRLLKSYKGIVFYDDIYLNNNMKLFWESIKLPKIATDWHISGFGIVEY